MEEKKWSDAGRRYKRKSRPNGQARRDALWQLEFTVECRDEDCNTISRICDWTGPTWQACRCSEDEVKSTFTASDSGARASSMTLHCDAATLDNAGRGDLPFRVKETHSQCALNPSPLGTLSEHDKVWLSYAGQHWHDSRRLP